MFYKNYRNEHQIDFISNLVDDLNTIVISLRNEDVLYLNKYGIDFLKKIDIKHKNIDINLCENKENEFFIHSNHIQSINKILESFFDSVFLDEKHETQQFFQNGTTSLSNIIKEKMNPNNELRNIFVKIGVFSSNDEKYNEQENFEE